MKKNEIKPETEALDTSEKLNYKLVLMKHLDRISILSFEGHILRTENAIDLLDTLLKPFWDEEYRAKAKEILKEIEKISNTNDKQIQNFYLWNDWLGEMTKLMARENLLSNEVNKE